MIYSIAHSKGGCGKSLLSLNLAPLINDLILIDLDTQNSITEINKARKKKHKIKTATTEKEFFNILDKYEDNNIVIDCGGIDSDINRLAIANSDILIIPVKDNSFEILAFKRFLKVINKILEKNQELKIFVLLNNVHFSTKDFSRLEAIIEKQKNQNLQLLNTIIRTRADFANYLEIGTTVYEKDKKSKASKEIKSLYKELFTKKGL